MRQYSKKINLRGKDNNTKFSYSWATLRKRHNHNGRLRIGDQYVSSLNNIKLGIKDFLQSFIQENLPFISLPHKAVKKIPIHMSDFLEKNPRQGGDYECN